MGSPRPGMLKYTTSTLVLCFLISRTILGARKYPTATAAAVVATLAILVAMEPESESFLPTSGLMRNDAVFRNRFVIDHSKEFLGSSAGGAVIKTGRYAGAL